MNETRNSIMQLFPAQAGVIPVTTPDTLPPWTVPRASGGDPAAAVDTIEKVVCSPRKRG